MQENGERDMLWVLGVMLIIIVLLQFVDTSLIR